MKIKWMTMLVITIAVFLTALAAWGGIVSNVEQPEYRVLSVEDQIEIREYKPVLVAEVTVQGDRKEAASQGFRLLADYIFGNNTASNKIAMTAPVTQQSSEKIAMTAPVIQQPVANDWTIHFMMPSEYTLDTLPRPNNQQVILKSIPARKLAVIQFSGINTNSNISKHEEELLTYLSQKNIRILSSPSYAFYNPPWTLPFLRRNEVMIEIETQDK